MENQNNVKKSSLSGNQLNATKSSDCKALNVFYPMAAAAAQPNRFKYNVSHYEVNLAPLADGATLTSANYAQTAEELQDYSVHFGGPLFHARVVKAAQVANAPFTRNQTAGNIDELVNAFYTVLYNSRTIYALLQTAFRCQDAVEAVDEDGLYLAPIFNDHYGQDLYLPNNATNTYATDTPMLNYANQGTRQLLCFSSPMSNAQWARLWSTATSCVKLPRGWRDWCIKYFGHHHQINPSNRDAHPRFVTFWPSARLLDTRNAAYVFVRMYSYYNVASGTGYMTWGNAEMLHLTNFVNAAAAIYQDLMNRYAQLEIMFRELNCNLDESFNYARDITGRTVRVVASYDVERLVYSVSMAYRICINAAGVPLNCFDDNTVTHRDYDTIGRLVINRDPAFMVNKLDADFIANSGPATFSYRDQVLLPDQEFALLKYQITPLEFTTIFVGAAGTAPQFRRMPLIAVSNYFLHAQSLIVGDNTYTYPIIGLAEAQLIELNTYQLPALPRAHWDIRVITSPSTGEVALEKRGYFTANMTNHYNLKDYVVPALLDLEWRDELCDKLTDSLSQQHSSKTARHKRSGVAKEVVGNNK